jgi:membrane fusion protein (multidrug efflux system)
VVLVFAALATGAALVAAGWTWSQRRLTVSTDDAYVESTVVPVSAKIAGQVLEVLVRDDEAVVAGQVLVRLDDRDWRARVEQARAGVRIARERHRAARARVEWGRRMVSSQEAQARAAAIRAAAARESAASVLEASRAAAQARRAALASAVADRDRARALRGRAVQDLARARELYARELVARQFVDHAEAEARAAEAGLRAAEERVAQARRDVESAEAEVKLREAGFEPQHLGLRTAEARTVEARALELQAEALAREVGVREAERDLAEAQLREAEADLALARLNLEHTVIRAPMAGVVTRKAVEVGQVVQPGQALLSLVSLDDVWEVANFKETQLRRVRPGLRADVVVDSFPDRRWRGTVQSISAGTGARFALLPPENATGNWVKVVQRVPVRIALEGHGPGNPHTLRAGMSAVVTVHLR